MTPAKQQRPGTALAPGGAPVHGVGERAVVALARRVAGRRTRWVVIGSWVALALVSLPFALRLGSAESTSLSDLLPGGTQSSKVLSLDRHFPSGRTEAAIVVYRRPGGLTRSDRQQVARDRADLAAAHIAGAGPPSPAVFAPNGTAAIFSVPVAPQQGVLSAAVGRVSRLVGSGRRGLQVAVTGPAGFTADVLDAFSGVDAALLVITAALVGLLLVITYRSPVLWLLPLASVGVAELVAQAVIYVLARAGVTVTGEATSLLTVVVFGAGTDYALLITSRYREELRHNRDRRRAMVAALTRVAPTVAASALTVCAGLCCLLVAQYGITRDFGLVSAIGVAVAGLLSLTLFPALLVACSRRVFWPQIPQFGSTDPTGRVWSGIARRIARRPRPVWVGAALLLAVMGIGLLKVNTNLTISNDLPASAGSVRGEALLAASFPAGQGAPLDVVVLDVSRVPALRKALGRDPGVASLGSVETAGHMARFNLVLHSAPSGQRAFSLVEELRATARRVAGDKALIGGQTAQDLDTAQVAHRDDLVVIPLVLAVVLVLLWLVLRAVVGPLLLVASVVATFAAALGLGSVMFSSVLGLAGLDPTVPLLTFVFLVALGVDYNIFLVGRARQEVARLGPTDGVTLALGATGGVLTSAGAILAGTFSVLTVLPLVPSREIGIVVALGVLLDTLLVRTVLIPALAVDLGRWFWWPTRAPRDDVRLR